MYIYIKMVEREAIYICIIIIIIEVKKYQATSRSGFAEVGPENSVYLACLL